MKLGAPLRDVRTASIVVGLVAAAVYTNSLWNEFAYDDLHQVVNNPGIQSLATLPEALTAPYWPDEFGRQLGLWRPATTTVLGLLYAVGDGSPVAFHAANVVGHAAVSVLVVLLLAGLIPLAAALVAGLVFAVHPVHVEAVSNVVGIAELLSTVAILAACYVHLRSPARSGWREALGIGVLYAVAFGAKEGGVTLPGLIFLLDASRGHIGFWEVGRYVKDRWPVYASMVVVAVGLLAGRYAVLGSIANPFAPLGADLLAEIPRIWTLGEVWVHYVRLWIFPLDLSADYSPNVIPISVGWHMTNVLGVTFALAVLVMSLLAWRRPEMTPETATSRTAAFGVVWFVIAISPISNVLFLSGVVLAERTLYLPTVGLAAATGWLVLRLRETRPKAVVAVLVLALVLGTVRTWTRTPTWRDNQTMFTTMLREVPHSGRAQWILGDEFLKTGNVSQALTSYRAAINLLGSHYTLLTDISQRLIEVGKLGAAESLLTAARREHPQFSLAPSLLAWLHAEHGDVHATEALARESLALYDADPTRYHLLAWSLAAQGRLTEAREARLAAEARGQGVLMFWQPWMYLAYTRRAAGDTTGAHAAVDSAWTRAFTPQAKAALDSVRVSEFSLDPLLHSREGGAEPPDR